MANTAVADINAVPEPIRSQLHYLAHQRSKTFRLAIVSGIAAFAVTFAITLWLFHPYSAMLGDNGIRYWPLLVLVPATMAVIAFSLYYIVALRSAVASFRQTVISGMAASIDPAMECIARAADVNGLKPTLLFENFSKVQTAAETMRGNRSGYSYQTAAFHAVTSHGRDQAEMPVNGILLRARLIRPFPALLVILTSDVPASISGLTARLKEKARRTDPLIRLDVPQHHLQLVTTSQGHVEARRILSAVFTPDLLAYCHSSGCDPLISCIGDQLSIALIRPGTGGRFDADVLDLAAYRLLFRDAAEALRLADHTVETLWPGLVNGAAMPAAGSPASHP